MRLDPPAVIRPRALSGVDRLIALVAVGVFGSAVLTVTGPAPVVSASAAATSRSVGAATVGEVVPSRPQPVVRTEGAVVHATPRRTVSRPAHTVTPARAKTAARSPQHRHVQPYVPSGTGMWIYQWHHTNGGSAHAIVARAKQVGLSTLFVRTGSSWDGFTGGHLGQLLRATRGTNVHVVAWDFPSLRHPVRDAHRLAHAARFHRGSSGPHVAAVAPDIETPAEGTFNAAWRVRQYLRVLNRHLPKGVTILATVPWPSRYRLADYPYRTVAQGSDVLVPMAYWYNNPPREVTARSISYLRRFNKPVQPVGQGYDGKLDVPSLRHNRLAREVPVFFRTAHSKGARAVSIWSWQSAPHATWRALARAHRLFDKRP